MSEMNLSILTSTKPGTFETTTTMIDYRINDGPIEKIVENLTEIPAILAVVTRVASYIEIGDTLIVQSQQNNFTKAFTCGWLNAWRLDGFKTKPRHHRERWAHLQKVVSERQLLLKVLVRSKAELKSTLTAHRLERPGAPVENPWDKPENADDIVQRAIRKQSRRDK